MLARIHPALVLAFAVPMLVGAQVPMTSPKPIAPPRDSLFGNVAMSPNGRFTIVERDAGLERFDRRTGQWAPVATVSTTGSAVTWSPNGRFIAFHRTGADDAGPFVWLLPIDSSTGRASGAARRISARPGKWPTWSPDGRRIAFVAIDSEAARIIVIPFNGGAETVLMERPGHAQLMQWAPDGRSIYMVYAPPKLPPRIARVNVASGVVDSVAPGGRLMGLSRDGKYLAQFTVGLREVTISAASNGMPVGSAAVPDGAEIRQWSPTVPNQMIGRQNVIDQNIHAVDVATGAVRAITTGKRNDQHPIFSPDGKRIAYLTKVGEHSRVGISNLDGSGARVIAGPTDAHVGFGWSPDGHYIVYRAPTALRLIDVNTGTDRELTPLNPAPNGGEPGGFRWRADSRAIRFAHGAKGQPHGTLNEVTLDGKVTEFATIGDSLKGTPHFISDTMIVFASAEHLLLVSATTGHLLRTIVWPDGKSYDRGFDITADGQWVGVGLADKPFNGSFPYILSLKTGEFRAIPYLGGEIGEIKMDPMGRYMVVESCPTCVKPNYVEHWNVAQLPFNGDPPRVLSAKDTKYLDANFYAISPDGRTVLYDAETYWGGALVEITLPPLKPKP